MKSFVLTLIVTLIPLSGCSILDDLANGPTFDPYTLYLDSTPVRGYSELLDRYTCASGAPLVCECTGSIGPCDCHC